MARVSRTPPGAGPAESCRLKLAGAGRDRSQGGAAVLRFGLNVLQGDRGGVSEDPASSERRCGWLAPSNCVRFGYNSNFVHTKFNVI